MDSCHGPAFAFDGTSTPNTALLTPSDGLRSPGAAPDGGEKAKALTALQYAADQGHLAAQWKVGRMYAAGDGVPQDDQRAFAYFSQIANTHPDETPGTAQARIVANAFVALGHYYLTGIPNSTVVQDAARARELFAYAASYFGDADAQYQLGRLYLDGTPSDPHQAARWLLLAATKGDCRAEAALGDLLFQGQQVPRQAARGLMWLTLEQRLRGLRGSLGQAALRQRLPSRERRRAGHGAGLSRRLAQGPPGLAGAGSPTGAAHRVKACRRCESRPSACRTRGSAHRFPASRP